MTGVNHDPRDAESQLARNRKLSARIGRRRDRFPRDDRARGRNRGTWRRRRRIRGGGRGRRCNRRCGYCRHHALGRGTWRRSGRQNNRGACDNCHRHGGANRAGAVMRVRRVQTGAMREDRCQSRERHDRLGAMIRATSSVGPAGLGTIPAERSASMTIRYGL